MSRWSDDEDDGGRRDWRRDRESHGGRRLDSGREDFGRRPGPEREDFGRRPGPGPERDAFGMCVCDLKACLFCLPELPATVRCVVDLGGT